MVRQKEFPTRMGFEPTRAEHIGLAVQRLNHSATSSNVSLGEGEERCLDQSVWGLLHCLKCRREREQNIFPCRELNPGLLGESQVS